VGFRSLREISIDTTTPQGRLVISVLASIGEFERELIAARMTEGRKRAVASGVKFGPKFKLNYFQRQEALARLAAGETQAVIARTYNVDAATISRLQRGV
jgi:DNA invertase Pin-like site-specific DNA recombinase